MIVADSLRSYPSLNVLCYLIILPPNRRGCQVRARPDAGTTGVAAVLGQLLAPLPAGGRHRPLHWLRLQRHPAAPWW